LEEGSFYLSIEADLVMKSAFRVLRNRDFSAFVNAVLITTGAVTVVISLLPLPHPVIRKLD
jgi:hypothetical protein